MPAQPCHRIGGMFQRMQQLAHQRSAAARTEADFIRRQLETDFAEATEEALERKKAGLEAARSCAKEAEAAVAALAGAYGLALRAARPSLDSARGREMLAAGIAIVLLVNPNQFVQDCVLLFVALDVVATAGAECLG